MSYVFPVDTTQWTREDPESERFAWQSLRSLDRKIFHVNLNTLICFFDSINATLKDEWGTPENLQHEESVIGMARLSLQRKAGGVIDLGLPSRCCNYRTLQFLFFDYGGFGMNRVVIVGIAMFVAIVGLTLLSGENEAQAGHGCHGCHGDHDCHGCFGLFKGCHGIAAGCCGAPVGCCGDADGGAVHDEDTVTEDGEDAADDVPEAPPEAASLDRAPTAFRTISFRR